jgi:hypothetical protein
MEINNQLRGIMTAKAFIPPTVEYELEDRAIAAVVHGRHSPQPVKAMSGQSMVFYWWVGLKNIIRT